MKFRNHQLAVATVGQSTKRSRCAPNNVSPPPKIPMNSLKINLIYSLKLTTVNCLLSRFGTPHVSTLTTFKIICEVRIMDESPDVTCQSCNLPAGAEKETVQCCVCLLWEHFLCAGVDAEVKNPGVQYTCAPCVRKQRESALALDKRLLRPSTMLARATYAGSQRKSSAHGSVVSNRSVLEEQLKLVEEEQALRER